MTYKAHIKMLGTRLNSGKLLPFNKCYKDAVIPKGVQWKWTVQFDATAEEEKMN